TLRGQVDGQHISYEDLPNGSFWLDPDDDDRGWIRAKWDRPSSSGDSWKLDLVWSQDIEGGVQIGPHGIPGNERLQYIATPIVSGKTDLQYQDGTIVPKHDTRTGRAFGRMCGAVADDPDTEGVDESREAFPGDTMILISQMNYGLNPRVRLQWHPQMLKEHNYPKQTYTYYLGDDLVNVTYAPVTCGQVCAKLNDC
ncbi:MAG: hypothetical protein OXI23_16990, partial [Gemmatimonadota bacterium]|nr:hypothetical protein [Gemmatimonadota bacterium]